MVIKEALGEWYESHKDVIYHTDFVELSQKLARELNSGHEICPPLENIFTAYQLTKPEDVRVCLISQDPYPTAGQAHGLAFSSKQKAIPASLRIIFGELQKDLGISKTSPDLTSWAEQGVLLLNTHLTTRRGQPLAHEKWGWDGFTGHTLNHVWKNSKQPVIFALWGRAAEIHFRTNVEFMNVPDYPREILVAPHPAAELYGTNGNTFTGCGHFSRINRFLKDTNQKEIEW